MKITLQYILHILFVCVYISSCTGTDGPDIQRFHSSESDHGDSIRGTIIYGEEPPEGSIMENWIMHYDDIFAIYIDSYRWGDETHAFYVDWRRDVKVVKTKNNFYIAGVSASYPDAWIKGEYADSKSYGSRIKFDDGQLLVRHINNYGAVSRYFTPSRFYGDDYVSHHGFTPYVKSNPAKRFIHFNYNKDEGILTLYVPEKIHDEYFGYIDITEFDYGFVLTKDIDKPYTIIIEDKFLTGDGHPYHEADSIRKEAEMYPHVWFEKKRQ